MVGSGPIAARRGRWQANSLSARTCCSAGPSAMTISRFYPVVLIIQGALSGSANSRAVEKGKGKAPIAVSKPVLGSIR